MLMPDTKVLGLLHLAMHRRNTQVPKFWLAVQLVYCNTNIKAKIMAFLGLKIILLVSIFDTLITSQLLVSQHGIFITKKGQNREKDNLANYQKRTNRSTSENDIQYYESFVTKVCLNLKCKQRCSNFDIDKLRLNEW